MKTISKTDFSPTKKFNCDVCDYNTCYKKDYNKHLSTPKHKRLTELLIKTNFCPNSPNSPNFEKIYECICGKKYKHASSLCKHKNNCVINNENNVIQKNNSSIVSENFITDKDLIISLLKQNAELLEIVKNGTHQFNTTNNTNCNNKTFNLQVFLNETCKDAMNIMDFVDSIKLQLTDLESVGELGYVKGMSNIIVKNLKALDVTKRPVHCSDAKREVLYIKDNDKWEKEDPENNKLRKAIKYISHKNILLLSKWREKYPDSQCSDSPQSDKYHHMVVEAMGGEGSTDMEKMNKIIRNIAKEVIIEK